MLDAFPPTQAQLRPHPRLRTAREIAWLLVQGADVATAALAGTLASGPLQCPCPETIGEIAGTLRLRSRALRLALREATEESLAAPVTLPSGVGKREKITKLDLLWTLLNDQIHHRGQLTVYLRMAGGRVPSVYGPTADEPW